MRNSSKLKNDWVWVRGIAHPLQTQHPCCFGWHPAIQSLMRNTSRPNHTFVRKRCKRYSGFTLLEILIALFIFAIISLMLSAGLRTVINAQEGTEKSAARLRELQFTLLMMSRDIEQTVDRPIYDASGKEEKALMGNSRELTLTHTGSANVYGSQAKSVLQRSRYYWDKSALWRMTWPVLDQAPKSRAERRELLGQVRQLRFQYLDQENRFHSDWPLKETGSSKEAGQNLPRAVKIELVLQNWGSISQLYVISNQPKAKAQQQMPPPKQES